MAQAAQKIQFAPEDLISLQERLVNKTKDVVSKAAEKVDDQAHQTPWWYVGAASAGAFVVGLLIGRRFL